MGLSFEEIKSGKCNEQIEACVQNPEKTKNVFFLLEYFNRGLGDVAENSTIQISFSKRITYALEGLYLENKGKIQISEHSKAITNGKHNFL